MQKLVLWNRKCLFVGTSLLLLLVFALAACSSSGFSTAATLITNSTAKTTPPKAQAAARSCPGKVRDPLYWDHIIGTHGDAKVENVICGKIMQYPGIQALITVRHHSQGSLLDVYVYANIQYKQPTQFFNLPGLYKGEAKISGYNTVLTAQVDLNSSINNNKPATQLKQDLFREFKWSDGAGTLVQTVFPGLYPDLTRYQAEADQEEVNKGTDLWKLDALETTRHFYTLLKTPSASSATIVSGGGEHDLYAVVNVTVPSIQGCCRPFPPMRVSLARLEGNTHGGIWVVRAVENENMAITSPRSHERMDSPVTITGSGVAFEGQIGIVRILDHLYNDIGHTFVMSQNTNSGFGPGTFSTPVKYDASFHGGSQEGILALYHQGGAASDFGVIMVKVLVEA
jgi:hypothetical protein